MKKPVIRWSGRLKLWVCKGCEIKEYGDTPSQAYVRWRILKDQKHYAKKHSRKHDVFSRFVY